MIARLYAVGFTVADMTQARDFFTQCLPFTVVSDDEFASPAYEQLTGIADARLRVVTLQLGAELLQLTSFATPADGRPIPLDSRSHDRWFQHCAIVVSDMDAAYAHLAAHGIVHVSTAPQTLPDYITAAAGIKAFYFRDPGGHNLELLWFPPDKGDPRWQNQQALFLGIDHTAIAVGDTATSRRLYGDLLGMRQAGESLNYGTEQEQLNGVPGCRVQITGWRAADNGMGVEFLEYLTPTDGRAMPADTRATDLVYWNTTLVCDDLDAVFQQLREASVVLVSPAIVELPAANPFGYRRALLVRDADGHALTLVEV